jgi:hypothetical protein
MRLTKDQLAQFEDEGYLFLPGLFTRKEVDVLMGEVPASSARTARRSSARRTARRRVPPSPPTPTTRPSPGSPAIRG